MNITAFKDLTRIEQTLFGLPFLLAGALLPLVEVDVSFSFRWFWIFPAFLLARISGMVFNQLIDRYIDAKNPRTEMRAIPSGRVTENQARLLAWSSLILFIFVCFQINILCFFLSPFAAFLLFIYSYLKRVTSSCHFVLGMIHFLGPVMASIAISGTILLTPIFLGFAAALSIIGNDIVYAIQDFEFDRSHNLFSLPSRLGIENSLTIARFVHILCLVMLLGVGITGHLPIFYYILIVVAAKTFYKLYQNNLKNWNFGCAKTPGLIDHKRPHISNIGSFMIDQSREFSRQPKSNSSSCLSIHKKVSSEVQERLFFSCNVMIAFSVFSFILASILWDVM